ncbi:MAG TPA: universal stress protein [Planctomycetaceae bacterium]|nr:universal stress protein [Planctomycetaceae bacterium]
MPLRFQHVLVPLDFTEANADLLTVVFDMASDNRARVTLLHVIEAIGDESDDELDEFYASLEPEARQKLATAAHRFVDAGLAVDQQVLIGRRMPMIVEFAVEREVDLIVIGSPRLDLANPQAGISSVGYQVSMFCQCPVLLLKHDG